MTIPQQIRKARKAAKLTQRQLADKLGVAQQRVAGWERGVFDPAASMYVKLLAVCKRARTRVKRS